MARPTVAEIRQWSKVDFGELTYADDADLQVLIDRSADYVEWATGREMDDSLPPEYAGMMDQAVQYKTEALAYQNQPDIVETVADFMLLSSFSVGEYSETRRSLTELKEAGMIDADPRLNQLLWACMTDDKRAFWEDFLSDENAPAFSVTEIDWSGRLLPSVLAGEAYYTEIDTFGTWPN